MADEKISAMTGVSPVKSGGHVPVVFDGDTTNYQAPPQDLSRVVKQVTLTGSGSTVLDPSEAMVFALTTSGNHANESVKLNHLPFSEPWQYGKVVSVYIINNVGGSDTVTINANGYTSVNVQDAVKNGGAAKDNPFYTYADLSKTYLNREFYDVLAFNWPANSTWSLNGRMSFVGGANIVSFDGENSIYWQAADNYSSNQASIYMTAARSHHNATKGGDFAIYGGDAQGTGSHGGDVILGPGSGTSGSGNVKITRFATANPGPNTLWVDPATHNVKMGY